MLLSLSIAVVGILFIDKEYEHWRKEEWIHATLIYVAVVAGLMFLLWLGSSLGSSETLIFGGGPRYLCARGSVRSAVV